jgi:hypothetical protein
MKFLLTTLMITALPTVLTAQSITCQTSIRCDATETCMTVDNILRIEVTDTKASFAFDDANPFAGRVARATDPMVIVSEDADTSPFQLVIGIGGEGAYSVVTTMEGMVEPAFYPLQCEIP